MKQVSRVLFQFHGTENYLLQKIAEHTGLPMTHVVRQAIRHYATTGAWPIGTNGIREQIIDAATVAGSKFATPKTRRKAKQ